MPQNAALGFSAPNFPAGYCPANWQQFANDFAAALSGYLPGAYSTINYGSTEPAATDRDKPWIRNDGRIYEFDLPGLGAWVSRHPLAPGSVMMYSATLESDIWSFDGGSGDKPSEVTPSGATGAMWEVVNAMRGRFPVCPGTLSPSGTVIANGATGGADQHTLTVAQMPAHAHSFSLGNSGAASVDIPPYLTRTADLTNQTGSTGGDQPHPTISPYLSIWIIRRTNRLWYRA